MPKDLVGIDESGFEHRVFLDTDPSLAAASDEKVASQKAVRQYVDDNAGGTVPVKATGAELVTGTDDAKFATAKALADALVVRGVKRYVALLTQSGTDAPVATILENTLGGTVVWTRFGEGVYLGTLAGGFPVDKTAVLIQTFLADPNLGVATAARRNDADSIEVSTGAITTDPIDSVLNATAIEIRVYP